MENKDLTTEQAELIVYYWANEGVEGVIQHISPDKMPEDLYGLVQIFENISQAIANKILTIQEDFNLDDQGSSNNA